MTHESCFAIKTHRTFLPRPAQKSASLFYKGKDLREEGHQNAEDYEVEAEDLNPEAERFSPDLRPRIYGPQLQFDISEILRGVPFN
ncbi:MAG: hypothetical protein COU07_00065 [Candidatus Harrisonbacteria bacterium CG10_big_fil_rev_8_21_14_0_10_40_38]|uniref:Uncharacterized protein n=1 Tax=Candidatus Harrisonbacteria bacterium CG10_big_fil_rev_8_21_14_0_10_40_38 TaxID=1974583 RepID=A0A2H0USD4_9BACT|nr:MAG: hypothetical protein COU07_00065 [Candidatus Harrisonbacteria bacterium CG10_big_fil_rev_8_21_14_0_10_40_38]